MYHIDFYSDLLYIGSRPPSELDAILTISANLFDRTYGLPAIASAWRSNLSTRGERFLG